MVQISFSKTRFEKVLLERLPLVDSLASRANALAPQEIFIDALLRECYTSVRFGLILPSDDRPSFAETRAPSPT